MRFYVPEWDDNVDANYDFLHDEHSTLAKTERELQYIWDIFDYDTTPIDGVLISREQVEESNTKLDNLTTYGVYHPESRLHLPDWLPTISDCGAWGYKSLPFPPYGNQEMLDFYEQMDVTVGVTIDHLVLGSGQEGRLYLDKRAFKRSGFTPSDIPETIADNVDVMVDEWPTDWPEYVTEYDETIYGETSPIPFERADFEGSLSGVLTRFADDPRAVYRENDTQFRYDLTLENAAEMKALYDAKDYSFRLMVAVQGWDADSYARATQDVLDHGYQYLGIGGVAGSPVDDVRDIVTAVGNTVKTHERAETMRVDTHVFGFAKTDAFDTVGQAGMASFDSASMLRAAWTGGDNYHLSSDRRYDAIRVRFGTTRDTLEESIEKALHGQELLHALRAFDNGESIADAIREWYATATVALDGLPPYLEANHLDEKYDQRLLRDVEQQFRDDYEYSRALRANFSRTFRRQVVKHLRDNGTDATLDEYESLVETARNIFETKFPQTLDAVEALEDREDEVATFAQIQRVVEDYVTADVIDDEEYLEAYEDLLRVKPWRECDCPICEDLGIEVAVFRANNRNRRRGFHNMRRFYDEFEEDLPKLLVATPATEELTQVETVEDYLGGECPDLWEQIYDLPVAEIGTLDNGGLYEWWTDAPSAVATDAMAGPVSEFCVRYDDLYLYDPDGDVSQQTVQEIEDANCTVHIYDSGDDVRAAVLDRLDYDNEFVPKRPVQIELGDF
ncbi:queuine tRNA-ribosyltransferase tRNA-guanine transglycosylase [Halorussus salilacus]|uniref:queuine tRNA-ribosyltransferase tRNA-guanine transglycosylase n=1 Tax=Halorussus salilacus TaxID=2953750 RepID=UPI0020A04D7C|nr:queuine tRNA-ribosyltransferase tRNA-guanine transglycosylase [Halorussus salilacus]USZ68524.1 queuine tRNA-ribosyltransferase tRNA-guanine transglycosylase [Halorussus salilacus]